MEKQIQELKKKKGSTGFRKKKLSFRHSIKYSLMLLMCVLVNYVCVLCFCSINIVHNFISSVIIILYDI